MSERQLVRDVRADQRQHPLLEDREIVRIGLAVSLPKRGGEWLVLGAVN